MSKFDRKKIAVTLAFAALFGNETSAVNSKSELKSSQTVGAVGGEKKLLAIILNWQKSLKLLKDPKV